MQCLQQGARSRSGKLTESHLADLEVRYADQIRQSTVAFLAERSNELHRFVESLPFMLDRSIRHGPYNSLEERLQMMSRTDEYAGYLEVTAVAYITQRPICIYVLQRHDHDNNLKLIARLPPAKVADSAVKWKLENKQPINIIHTFDTDKQPGHFDLLVDNNVTLTEDPLSLEAFMSTLVDIGKRQFTFTDVLCGYAAAATVDQGAEKEKDSLSTAEDPAAILCSAAMPKSW